MKITINSLGSLVRPRIMSHARIYPRLDGATEQDKTNLNAVVEAPYYGQKDINLYKKPYEEIFSNLVIGDTTKNLSNCYVGVITCFITSINYKHYVLVNSKNIQDILDRFRKRHKNRKTIPVHFVGIKFYKGLQRNEDGILQPINPWELTNETVWFYRPWDLIFMETIIRYEKLEVGDLVLFKRTKGLVVKNKTINKTKFYKTNSWSCKSVMVFSGNGKSFLKFLPNKSFKGIKSKKT